MTGPQPWNDQTAPQRRPGVRPRWKKKRYWIPAAGLAAFVGLGTVGAITAPPAPDPGTASIFVDDTVTAAPTTAATTPATEPTTAPPATAAPTTTPPPVTMAPTTRPAPTAAPTKRPPRTVAPLPRKPRPAPTTARPKPKPAPPRTTPPPPPRPSSDPRFATCKAAKAAGYGPYVQGQDLEYDWYRDADGDGIVCE